MDRDVSEPVQEHRRQVVPCQAEEDNELLWFELELLTGENSDKQRRTKIRGLQEIVVNSEKRA